jgi:hypothetical protein
VIAPQFPSYPWLKPSDNKPELDTRGLVVLIANFIQIFAANPISRNGVM